MVAAKDMAELKTALQHYQKMKLPRQPLPALDHLVFAVLLDGTGDAILAHQGVQLLRDEFVDWNECRVARRAEIARLLDALPDADSLAVRLREMLNKLFDLHGAMDLSFAEEMKPTEARKLILGLDADFPRPILSMVLYEVCPGTTLPLSSEALSQARKQGLIGRSGSKQQLQKKMQAELTPEEASALAQYLEIEAEGSGRGGAGKTSRKSTSRKTAKKATARKSKSKSAKTTKKGKTAKKTSRKK